VTSADRTTVAARALRQAFVAILAAASVAAQSSTPVTAHLVLSSNEAPGSACSFSGQPATKSDTLPPGVARDSAVVFRDYSDRRTAFVFCPDKGSGVTGGCLWGDFDRDGVYGTNETIMITENARTFSEASPFSLLVTDGGHPHRIRGNVRLYHYGSYWNCSIATAFAFRGALTIAARPYEILIRNGDGSGSIADAVALHDGVRLSLRPAGSTNDWREIPLKKTLGLAGALYDVGLSFEGGLDAPSLNLVLTPIPTPVGSLSLAGTNIQSLLLEDSRRAILIERPERSTTAPTGTWAVTEVFVNEDGIEFEGTSPQPVSPFTVEEGQTVRLEEGGPVRYTIRLGETVYGAVVSLNLGKAKGLGNREYQVRGPRLPLKWALRRPGGKSLDCGVFEYG